MGSLATLLHQVTSPRLSRGPFLNLRNAAIKSGCRGLHDQHTRKTEKRTDVSYPPIPTRSSPSFKKIFTDPVTPEPGSNRRHLALKPSIYLQEATATLDVARCKPLDLLEAYQSRGIVDLDIALLCLRPYSRLDEKLSEDRLGRLVSERAGTRALKWLWSSEAHRREGHTDHQELKDIIVELAIAEGREDILWDWLKIDEKLSGRLNPNSMGKERFGRERFAVYDWKGRLLRAMINEALWTGTSTKSGGLALDMYLRAHALVGHGIRHRTHMALMSLNAARLSIYDALISGYKVSPERFDDFLAACAQLGASPGMHVRSGVMMLHHPTKSDARPLYRTLMSIYVHDRSDERSQEHRESLHAASRGRRKRAHQDFLSGVVMLHRDGHIECAEQLRSVLNTEFSDVVDIPDLPRPPVLLRQSKPRYAFPPAHPR